MRLVVAVLLIMSAVAFGQETRDENEVVFSAGSDPEMVAAIRQARASLDEFLAVAASPPTGTSGFKLKVMVKDGNDTEHFWITPFRTRGATFEGTLANEPRVVRTMKAGQTITFSRADISDWGYVRSGRQVGSFTVCALFKKMPKDQADYYRKNHGFDC